VYLKYFISPQDFLQCFFLISQSPEEMKITWVIDIELLVHSFTSFFILKKMKYSPFVIPYRFLV